MCENTKPSKSGNYLTSEQWDAMKAAGFSEEELQADQPSGPIIFSYSRQQAIDDGVLVDVDAIARELGFRIPVVITAALHGSADRAFSPNFPNVSARERDALVICKLLSQVRATIKAHMDKGGESTNRCYFRLEGEQVIIDVGPGDDARPVMTVMLPEDD